MEPKKPSRRQIVFNWLMDEPDFATKPDGHWSGSDDVARVDALLAALDSASDASGGTVDGV
jgi:hypothetical protein